MLLPPHAWARPLGLGQRGPGIRTAAIVDQTTRGVRSGNPRLRSYAERQTLSARVRLRELNRDAERRISEAELRASGSMPDLERYRQRVDAEEKLDRLKFESELDRLLAFGRLGPATRRVLQRHRLELRRLVRDDDLRLRLRELEERAAQREADLDSRGAFGGGLVESAPR